MVFKYFQCFISGGIYISSGIYISPVVFIYLQWYLYISSGIYISPVVYKYLWWYLNISLGDISGSICISPVTISIGISHLPSFETLGTP